MYLCKELITGMFVKELHIIIHSESKRSQTDSEARIQILRLDRSARRVAQMSETHKTSYTKLNAKANFAKIRCVYLIFRLT